MSFINYEAAKKIIKGLNITSAKNYSKIKKTEGIPKRPDIFYKEWISWSEFLGTNNLSNSYRNKKYIKNIKL